MGVSLPTEHPVQASSSTNSHQGHFPHGSTTASFWWPQVSVAEMCAVMCLVYDRTPQL